MGVYLVAILKIGTITFVIQKAVKVAGSKDFSDIIKLAGVALIGVQIISLVSFEIAHPPKIITVAGSFINGISGFMGKANDVLENGWIGKILNFGAK